MSVRAISRETRERQHRASDPRASAWVSAHAGSGKTHVLSQRVVRLLLAGVPPSRLLCLTYTKAAAANMAARISAILAKWTLLADDELSNEIVGTGANSPSAAQLLFARRLFARTLETPGGLKIQTIHAFCERLLHLFPFEANVAAGFRVLDDMERAELLERARHQTLSDAVRHGGALHEALQFVAGQTSGNGFQELIRELVQHRSILQDLADPGRYADRLRSNLGLDRDVSLSSVERSMIEEGIAPGEWPAIAKALRQGGRKDCDLATHLESAVALAPALDCVDDYLRVFFKTDGDPRGVGKQKIISKGLQDEYPELLTRMEAERDRLTLLAEKRKAAATLERSLALARIGDAVLSSYRRLKESRGLFDFDDLIERTRALLCRTSVSWVLFKLDQQIDHILVDEAQDTSSEQWDILASLADEFCAGAGAKTTVRTFFAVGDEKQSIFSFQGAAPEKFDAMRRRFQASHSQAELLFEPISLTRSFRSVPDILACVDDVFRAGENRRGLSADPEEPAPRHEAAKVDIPGLVEIWEPIGPQKIEPRSDWRLPLDFVSDANPAAQLASKIARKIKFLLDPAYGECVEDNGATRGVEPGDIMILVRKRDAFFESMIAALKSERIAVAGADRLNLTEHIAVMDLVALGRAALLREDDLTLATLLKSPFVGFDDDALLEIAPRRDGSLFDALERSEDPKHRAAAQQIKAWSQEARSLAPFDFYSRLLGAGGGRERLVSRLGSEANDAIDEFLQLALAFEREQAPSLVNFLASVEALDVSVKRDMEAAGASVRVMTVHAAKGLEAKIVFLPDTCGAPSGQHDPKIFPLGAQGGVALAWSLKMESDPQVVSSARERLREAAHDEHRRLLYVAMTRAEERLYVAAYHGARGPARGCWYGMIKDALGPSCQAAPDPDDGNRQILWRGSRAPVQDITRAAASAPPARIPDFARAHAENERAPLPPLRPSSALAGADGVSFDDAPGPTRVDSERVLIGRLMHALLQHLPETAPERRLESASRFLALRGPGLSVERRERLARAAIGVIEDASLAPLFGPNSAAEVDIVARLKTAGGELALSGRIDRLAESGNDVFVADFKTGAQRERLGPRQLRQLALYRAAVAPLYPTKRVRCYLVWTQNATAIEASEKELDDALASIISERGCA
jgi:ATP-dependent helicase/nuclease subunit A